MENETLNLLKNFDFLSQVVGCLSFKTKEYEEDELRELVLHDFRAKKIKSLTLYLPKL
jgi:hypothetical protein